MSGPLVPASTLLREAAEHIEVVGLNQDGNMYRANDRAVMNASDEELPCCTMGALSVVYRRHSGDQQAIAMGTYNARTFLYAAPEILPVGSIAEWNDLPTTTQADVVRVMREAADRAEGTGA